jgi:hypothetical protein
MSFREDFLFGMAEAGVSPEEFGAYLLRQQEKQASGARPGFIVDPSGVLGSISSVLLDIPLAVQVGAPILGGAIGGKLLYDLSKPKDSTMIKRIKDEQLAKELRTQSLAVAQRIRRRAAANPEQK